jgi:hypothetical protein
LIVACDLSTTNLGLVAVPLDWGLDFARVFSDTLGTDPTHGDLVERRILLARDVVTWVEWARIQDGARAVEVWFEGYPLGGRAHNVDLLCELGGVVKHELWRELGQLVRMAPVTSARRVLGVANRKAEAQAAMKAIAPELGTEHERDAFVVANYALAEAGLPFVSIAPSRPRRTVRGKVRRRARRKGRKAA